VGRDVEVGEPRHALVELQRRRAEVEPARRGDPEADLDERDERRERAGVEGGERRDPDEQPGGDGQEDQDRRQPVVHRVVRKTTARTARPETSASAYERTSPFCARATTPPPRPKPRARPVIEPAIT